VLSATLLQPPVTDWVCPGCGHTDRTRQAQAHTRMHACPKAGGMTVPLVVAGTRAKLVLHERDDYVGTEDVQVADDGKVYMSAEIVRDDGNDIAVYAPTAYGEGSG
jgi:hypothetical protein